ncbi:MAG TPA: hypothetical protein DDW65_10155 [Firmicutes bacterium]|jgi:hypothetical protein|nr:hypothetical protein [Bacillota bacterium]
MDKSKSSAVTKFFKILIVLLILAGMLFGLQYYLRILDKPLQVFNNFIEKSNRMVSKDMFWGISTGTIFFIAILIILPILMHKINTRSYFKNLFQGLISSFIFFISQIIYNWCAKISKFYLLVAIVAIAIITLILIKIVAGMYKKEADQVEFRTAYVASITAGLIFSVLLQLVTLWSNWLKVTIHFKLG